MNLSASDPSQQRSDESLFLRLFFRKYPAIARILLELGITLEANDGNPNIAVINQVDQIHENVATAENLQRDLAKPPLY